MEDFLSDQKHRAGLGHFLEEERENKFGQNANLWQEDQKAHDIFCFKVAEHFTFSLSDPSSEKLLNFLAGVLKYECVRSPFV